MIQTVREKFSCRACETITQPPAPFHPIARGRAGPNLLAMILDAKFGQHQPLNRQSEAYAREGIELDVSTLADWVGACTATLSAAGGADRDACAGGRALHGDDTTVPVLAKGKTDHRPIVDLCARRPAVRRTGAAGGDVPLLARPARRASEPAPGRLWRDPAGRCLCRLQRALLRGTTSLAALTEAACWAHGRRKLFELAELAKAPLAIEAVRRIDAIFDVERAINGLPREQRRAVRQAQHRAARRRSSRPGCAMNARKLSRHADVAKAMDYMLKRWAAFTRFLDDGRICLTNNAAERALRGIALGRKAWLFAGSDRGGERAAAMYSLIVTAKLTMTRSTTGGERSDRERHANCRGRGLVSPNVTNPLNDPAAAKRSQGEACEIGASTKPGNIEAPRLPRAMRQRCRRSVSGATATYRSLRYEHYRSGSWTRYRAR